MVILLLAVFGVMSFFIAVVVLCACLIMEFHIDGGF